MRALVIGAGGFVGGYLMDHLREMGDEVIATTVASVPVSAPVKTVTLDITDASAVGSVLQSVKPDVVYHLAGIAFVPEAEGNFDKTLAVNVAGTANIARHSQLLPNKPVVLFISSARCTDRFSLMSCPFRKRTSFAQPTTIASASAWPSWSLSGTGDKA